MNTECTKKTACMFLSTTIDQLLQSLVIDIKKEQHYEKTKNR